jgi:hypothetical protein
LKELLTAGPHLSVSGAKRKGRRRCWAGGESRLGQRGPSARAREKKEKAAGLELVHGLKGMLGRRGEKRGRGRRKGFPFSFEISFQIHFSNIQTPIKQKSMHSNHDAQTLIISRLF